MKSSRYGCSKRRRNIEHGTVTYNVYIEAKDVVHKAIGGKTLIKEGYYYRIEKCVN